MYLMIVSAAKSNVNTMHLVWHVNFNGLLIYLVKYLDLRTIKWIFTIYVQSIESILLPYPDHGFLKGGLWHKMIFPEIAHTLKPVNSIVKRHEADYIVYYSQEYQSESGFQYYFQRNELQKTPYKKTLIKYTEIFLQIDLFYDTDLHPTNTMLAFNIGFIFSETKASRDHRLFQWLFISGDIHSLRQLGQQQATLRSSNLYHWNTKQMATKTHQMCFNLEIIVHMKMEKLQNSHPKISANNFSRLADIIKKVLFMRYVCHEHIFQLIKSDGLWN